MIIIRAECYVLFKTVTKKKIDNESRLRCTNLNFSLFSMATKANAQPVKNIILSINNITELRSAFFPLAVTFPKNPKIGGIPRL